MIGVLIAWLILMSLSYLLVAKALRKPELTVQERRNGNLLTLGALVMQVVLGLWTLGSGLWSPVFPTPSITSVAEFDSPDRSWGRFEATVSTASELADEQQGYAAYIEYETSMRNANVRYYRGRGTVVELSDGTLIETPELEYATYYARNWAREANFSYIKPGDTVVFKGHVIRVGEADERGVTHRLSDLEVMYRGSEAEWQQSAPKYESVVAGYIYLVMAGLTIIAFFGTLTGLVRSVLLGRREKG